MMTNTNPAPIAPTGSTSQEALMAYSSCVACSGDLAPCWPGSRVATCQVCGGIHFSGSVAQAIEIVDFRSLVEGESAVYFDFELGLGDGQTQRVHGWADDQGRMVQVG